MTKIEDFKRDTGVDIFLSEISDGNMHPNLVQHEQHLDESERDPGLAQERFNRYCLRHGVDPDLSAGMRVDPSISEVADIVRYSLLQDSEIGTVDPFSRRQASGLILEGAGSASVFTLIGDCYPVVLVPEGSEKLALLHVNWRAIEAGIGALALEALSADPADTKIYIGPGIKKDFNWHSALSLPKQIDDPEWEPFILRYKEGDHDVFSGAGVTLGILDKFLSDLKNLGVREENIYQDDRDSSDPALFSRRETLRGSGTRDVKPRGNNVLIARRPGSQ